MARFLAAIHDNLVSLISLVVAIIALTFNTNRADRTEYQRNIRSASFSVLKELNQLQLLVDQAHYGSDRDRGNPIVGWARVNYIDDLSEVIPEPVQGASDQLKEVWGVQVNALGVAKNASDVERAKSLESNEKISQQITHTRMAVKHVLQSLD